MNKKNGTIVKIHLYSGLCIWELRFNLIPALTQRYQRMPAYDKDLGGSGSKERL
jgi:hypothetical protein